MVTRGVLLSVALALLAPFALLAGATEEGAESSTQMAVPAGKYKEAPMLAALVAAGELPPVDERLPLEPRVAPPVEEVGTYGGTLNVVSIDKNPWNDITESPENVGARFLEMTGDGSVVPDLARAYELTDDGKSFTVYMREGAKWSDGHPLTADDVVFAFEDMHWNDQVETWNLFPGVSRVIKVDDYNGPLRDGRTLLRHGADHGAVAGRRVGRVSPQALPGEVAHQPQRRRRSGGRRRGLRLLVGGVPLPLLVGAAERPGQAHRDGVADLRSHRHGQGARAQSILLPG